MTDLMGVRVITIHFFEKKLTFFPRFQYVPRPTITPSNRGSTTTAAVTTGAGGPRGGRAANKVRQTMNGIDIQAHNYEEKQTNGSSENMPPPAPARGETKLSTIPPEKMETVSKGTGASKCLRAFLRSVGIR